MFIPVLGQTISLQSTEPEDMKARNICLLFYPPYNESTQSDALRPMSQRWVHEALFILSWSKMMLFVHCVYALRQAEWAGDVE